MNLNDEMVEMMKFYEFYKKIKASEEKDKLTNKNSELFHKTILIKNINHLLSSLYLPPHRFFQIFRHRCIRIIL